MHEHDRLRPTSLDRRGEAGRFQIRTVSTLALLAKLQNVIPFIVQIAHGGDAKAQCLRQSGLVGAVGMDVDVDQTWQKGMSRLRVDRAIELDWCRGDLGDLAILHEHRSGLDNFFAIEYTNIFDQERRHLDKYGSRPLIRNMLML